MILYAYNGGLTTGGQQPDGFLFYGEGGTITVDPTTTADGSGGSLKVDNSNGGNFGCTHSIEFDSTDAVRRVRIKFRYKCRDLERGKFWWYCGRCFVQILDQSGKVLNPHDQQVGEMFAGESDWKSAERTMILPPGASSLKLTFAIENATGTAWFDDITVSVVPQDYRPKEDTGAAVRIDPDSAIGDMSFGFGWNWEFTSFWRYPKGDTIQAVAPHGNWRSSSWYDFPDAETRFFDQIFNYAKWDGQSFVRMGVDVSHFPPKNYEPGQDTGQEFDYDFNTPYIEQDCKVLDFHEKRNIHVLLANWGTGADQPYTRHGNWLRKGYYEMSNQDNADWFLPYSDRRYAEAVAALVHYFRVVRGYKCVKYVSMCNEPNGPWTVEGAYPEHFFKIQNLLAEELAKRGVRDQVKIVAAESVEPGPSAKISIDAAEKLGQNFVDVVSVHDYDHSLGFAIEDVPQFDRMGFNIDAYSECIDRLHNMHGRKIPLLLGEFGGLGPYPVHGRRHLFLCTLSSADYALRCLNVGVGGFLRWVYNHPGEIQHTAFHVEDGSVKPNAGLYYPWAVLSRWTSRGSSVLRTQVQGGEDEEGMPRVRAAALRLPSGELTVLLTNTGSEPKSVTLSGLPEGDWHHYACCWTSHDSLSEQGVSQSGDGVPVLTLQPESVNALTNCTVGLEGDAQVDQDLS